MEKIYRFVRFESFIDTIIRKNLTFVHPSLWEDPYELFYLYKNISQEFNKKSAKLETSTYAAMLEYMVSKRLYAQAWTKLDESDALWRIYSYSGTSIRIAVDREKIKCLENVEILDVRYVNNYTRTIYKNKSFYYLIGIKRKAFAHEKEIRLVSHYKYLNTDDAENDIKKFLALNGVYNGYFKNIPNDQLDEEINKIVDGLNFSIKEKTKEISFAHIDNFIDSVLLNPFAPDWVDKTLGLFCQNYNLNYLGKSNLYNNTLPN